MYKTYVQDIFSSKYLSWGRGITVSFLISQIVFFFLFFIFVLPQFFVISATPCRPWPYCFCIFRYQAVESSSLSVSVSHFLNCFLSSPPDLLGTQQMDRLSSKRRSRRRRSRGSVSGEITSVGASWASLTSSELWRTIQAEAREYYHYRLPWWEQTVCRACNNVSLTYAVDRTKSSSLSGT